MYRTQVSPHRHGFLVERQYDASDRGTWITIERYFTNCLDQPRKQSEAWMMRLFHFLNQPSANLLTIEIPIAPPIAYNIHERLERAEAEIEALRAGTHDVSASGAPETIFESLENLVTEVSNRHP